MTIISRNNSERDDDNVGPHVALIADLCPFLKYEKIPVLLRDMYE